MQGNGLTNQRPGNKDSVEHDQKSIRPREAHNELAHQILAKSEQLFAAKVWKVLDQSEARKQWSMTKSYYYHN